MLILFNDKWYITNINLIQIYISFYVKFYRQWKFYIIINNIINIKNNTNFHIKIYN